MRRSSARELPLPPLTQVTPSNPQYWRGSKGSAEERFTREQIAWIERSGKLEAEIETITVRSTATMRELWWPHGEPAPVFVFECPVIQRRRDGKVKVVSPSGSEKLVYDDGSISKIDGPARSIGAPADGGDHGDA